VETETILSLDISSKTGWAFFECTGHNLNLINYGTLDQIHTPEGTFPESFVTWAHLCFDKIVELIKEFRPGVLIIEQTSAGSKAIFTQKILEWIHLLLAQFIVDKRIKTVYFMTEEWRRETGCLMSKEEKKRNAKVSKLKAKQKKDILEDRSLSEEEKKDRLKTVRAKIDGKVVGRTGRKHVNVRRANEVFSSQLKEPLRKKDEDTADSLLLGYCYFLRRLKSSEEIQNTKI
jgi:hypothetical protein